MSCTASAATSGEPDGVVGAKRQEPHQHVVGKTPRGGQKTKWSLLVVSYNRVRGRFVCAVLLFGFGQRPQGLRSRFSDLLVVHAPLSPPPGTVHGDRLFPRF